jgi:hypothetical protein
MLSALLALGAALQLTPATIPAGLARPAASPLLTPADLDRDGRVDDDERAAWLAQPTGQVLPVAAPKRAAGAHDLGASATPDLYDDLSPRLKNRLTPVTDFERAQDAVARDHKKKR